MNAVARNGCCPFCQRPLPPSAGTAGRRITCAGCQQEVDVPGRAGSRESWSSRFAASPLYKLLLVVFFAGMAVGGYRLGSIGDRNPPTEAGSRSSVVEEQVEPEKPEVDEVVAGNLPPAPTPETSKPAPSNAPGGLVAPAKPDPVAWLLAHPDRWPAEVHLTKPTTFPIFYQGRLAGSAQPPAGTSVLLVSVLPARMIVASYEGNSRHISVAETDLEARALAEMAKPEPLRSVLASATPKALTPEERKWREQFAATGKVGSSMDAPRASDSAPAGGGGHVTYTLEKAKDPTPEQQKIYEGITQSMDRAIGYYDQHSTLKKKLTVAYSPGTPTADGNFNGHIRLGSQRTTRACMHEMGHTMGVGTHPKWLKLMVDGRWQGPNANKVLQEYTHKPDAQVHGDRAHFWPGGLNFETEVKSEQDLIFHVKMVQAIVQDLDAVR